MEKTSSRQNACNFPCRHEHITAAELKTDKILLHLEAVQGYKEPQDIVGALEDSEDSQIPHHSFHSRILQKPCGEMMKTDCFSVSFKSYQTIEDAIITKAVITDRIELI